MAERRMPAAGEQPRIRFYCAQCHAWIDARPSDDVDEQPPAFLTEHECPNAVLVGAD